MFFLYRVWHEFNFLINKHPTKKGTAKAARNKSWLHVFDVLLIV